MEFIQKKNPKKTNITNKNIMAIYGTPALDFFLILIVLVQLSIIIQGSLYLL